MANQKHLTPEDRQFIQESLARHASFKEIGRKLDKDYHTSFPWGSPQSSSPIPLNSHPDS